MRMLKILVQSEKAVVDFVPEDVAQRIAANLASSGVKVSLEEAGGFGPFWVQTTTDWAKVNHLCHNCGNPVPPKKGARGGVVYPTNCLACRKAAKQEAERLNSLPIEAHVMGYGGHHE